MLVPVASIRHVAEFPTSTGWWHGLNGYFYFSHVDDEPDRELCEITVRSFDEPEVPGRTATWAIPSTNDRVRARCGVRTDISPDPLAYSLQRRELTRG